MFQWNIYRKILLVSAKVINVRILQSLFRLTFLFNFFFPPFLCSASIHSSLKTKKANTEPCCTFFLLINNCPHFLVHKCPPSPPSRGLLSSPRGASTCSSIIKRMLLRTCYAGSSCLSDTFYRQEFQLAHRGLNFYSPRAHDLSNVHPISAGSGRSSSVYCCLKTKRSSEPGALIAVCSPCVPPFGFSIVEDEN